MPTNTYDMSHVFREHSLTLWMYHEKPDHLQEHMLLLPETTQNTINMYRNQHPFLEAVVTFSIITTRMTQNNSNKTYRIIWNMYANLSKYINIPTSPLTKRVV